MMFKQMGDGKEKETDWYYGMVVDIVNPKKELYMSSVTMNVCMQATRT